MSHLMGAASEIDLLSAPINVPSHSGDEEDDTRPKYVAQDAVDKIRRFRNRKGDVQFRNAQLALLSLGTHTVGNPPKPIPFGGSKPASSPVLKSITCSGCERQDFGGRQAEPPNRPLAKPKFLSDGQPRQPLSA